MALSGKSLNDASAAGPGAIIIPDSPKQVATITVVAIGNPTFEVSLEGSVDMEHWFSLGTTQNVVGAGIFTFTAQHSGQDNGPVSIAFRANLKSFTDNGSGSTVSASIAIKP